MAASPVPETLTQPELVEALDDALLQSIRLASNRAEHIRLTRMRCLVDRLRTTVTTVT